MDEAELASFVQEVARKEASDFYNAKAADIDAKIEASGSEAEKKYAEIFTDSRVKELRKGNEPRSPSLLFARAFRMKALASGQNIAPIDVARACCPNDSELLAMFDAEKKSGMEVSLPGSGGFGVPQVLSDRVIDILYAKTVLDKIGVPRIPMPNGNMSFPRMSAAASVAYIGEARALTKTAPTFDLVKLSAKKLGATVYFSNDLLRQNTIQADAWVLRELQRRMMLAIDYAALYGAGSEFSPKGMLMQTGVQTPGTSSTAFPAATVFTLIGLLETANAPMDNVAWIFHPYLKQYLMSIVSTTGQFIFRDEMVKGTLGGYPFFTSTALPYTSGSPGYGDFVISDWSEALWGDSLSMEMRNSVDASLTDGAASVSMFETDCTATRVLAEHDFNVMHGPSFVKGTYKLATS